MSGIILSSSVRQNLLSLQSTAELLSTTQNRLATGKKVNTALDNPTNFFTAQSLDNRSSDISNLLDSIGNGVQVPAGCQHRPYIAAEAGRQRQVDRQSGVASHRRLFQQVHHIHRSDLRARPPPICVVRRGRRPFTGAAPTNNLTVPASITTATVLKTASNSDTLSAGFATNDTVTVDGQTLTFVASGASGANQINITDTVGTLLGKIDGLSGG
jgi:flagellin